MVKIWRPNVHCCTKYTVFPCKRSHRMYCVSHNIKLTILHLIQHIWQHCGSKVEDFHASPAQCLVAPNSASSVCFYISILNNLQTQPLWRVYFHSRLHLQAPTFLCLQPHHHLPSTLSDHVSTKTKQSIFRGEYVEFDLLLPGNSSFLTDNTLTRLFISVDGKQVDLPKQARKKAWMDCLFLARSLIS